jgi:hypothetical protein
MTSPLDLADELSHKARCCRQQLVGLLAEHKLNRQA